MDYDTLQQLDKWVVNAFPDAPNLYRTGSSCLPWIQRPHDVDYITFCDESFRAKYPKRNCYINWIRGHLMVRADPYDIPYILYTRSYCIPLSSQSTSLSLNDFLTNPVYKQQFISQVDIQQKLKTRAKELYHIYTTLTMWVNNDWSLSDQEQVIINHFHDKEFNDDDLLKLYTKYNYIKEALC